DDVAFAVGADKDERIVGGAVEFDAGHFASLCERVAHSAVDLWRAAQAVGVLNARVFFGRAVRFADLAKSANRTALPKKTRAFKTPTACAARHKSTALCATRSHRLAKWPASNSTAPPTILSSLSAPTAKATSS